MSDIEYDEKGKVFSRIVRKDTLRTRIQTTHGQVIGNLHIHPDHRLKDEVMSDPFLAVTQAELTDASGQLRESVDLILINRDHIVWLVPLEMHHGH